MTSSLVLGALIFFWVAVNCSAKLIGGTSADSDAASFGEPRNLQVSGNAFTFFRRNEYCEEFQENRYRTVSVLSFFSFFYELFNSNSVSGSCGLSCADICNHVDCVLDFESLDDAQCTCFPEVTTTSCGSQTICVSDTCTCESGYEGDPLVGCTDINECTDPSTCGPNGACSNIPEASFTCNCDTGYMWDQPDGGCVDIDECLTGTPCGSNASCNNIAGSFVCLCDPGFSGNPPSTLCSDIDECAADPTLCVPGSCINTEGAYTCSCNAGFTSEAANGGGCEDVNECDDPQACAASEACTNTLGSFECECNDGFMESPAGCIDINECSTGSPCGPNAMCTNIAGSFTCECDDFFDGGAPPNCRKLVEYEECDSVFSCDDGLQCEFASRSDQETTTCCAAVGRCNVSETCCNGAYTQGQQCPSQNDLDCRGDLTCIRRAPSLPFICCENIVLGLCVDFPL